MSTIDLGKDAGRSDFEDGEYDKEIRSYGYKLLWSSGELCPCRLNGDTEQPDPTCFACDGGGWLYSFPDPDGPRIIDYDQSPKFLNTANARATQAIMTSMTNDVELFEKYGEFINGTAKLTTFSFHRLGNRDRFTMVDSVMPYKQTLIVPENKIIPVRTAKPLDNLRYPIKALSKIIALENSEVIDLTNAAIILPDGSLDLTNVDVSPSTRISVRYDMNPVWIIVDFPYAARGSRVKLKSKSKLGDYITFPMSATVRLDFLLSSR